MVSSSGGIFAHGADAGRILARAMYAERTPLSLRPRAPRLLKDARYCIAKSTLEPC